MSDDEIRDPQGEPRRNAVPGGSRQHVRSGTEQKRQRHRTVSGVIDAALPLNEGVYAGSAD